MRGHREDADCLKIEISRDNDVKSKSICCIYFLAVHSQEVEMESTVTNLPLCLTKGSEKLVENILLIVERQYDSVIYPLNLEPMDLKWMFALWSGTDKDDTENDQDKMKLRYRLPEDLQNKGLEHIDVKFTPEQIRGFWQW